MKAIKVIFKTFLLSLTIVAQVHFAFTQTQGDLIPNGKNVFLDNNGKPLSSGKVYFYTQGTTTPKTTYQDINQTIPNPNPVILDAGGKPPGAAGLWGVGVYRQQVFDKNNNLIWDVNTSSGNAPTGPTATGDGDAVGTIKPWPGATAPNQYMFTYNQELNRTTYAPLFQAITSQQNVNCSSGSPALTGLSNTDSFWIGMKVELACLSGGSSTVASKTAFTVTLAANANVTETITATFFMWGNGNGSTTFNLPDYRGLIPMGNNIMGGVASSNISDTYFGSQSANSAGGQGGNDHVTLATGNLPPYTPTGSISNSNNSFNEAGSGTSVITPSGSIGVPTLPSIMAVTSTFTGSAQGGTSTPFGVIPPTKTINYIIKVTPDAAFSGTGVTSLGGMTGDIVCGNGLTCAGNTISSNSLSTIVVGTTPVSSGTTAQVLIDNGGVLGQLTPAQLTAGINLATATLSGALPAWPNNTTTYFRGDGSYQTLNAAALYGLGTGVATALGNTAGGIGGFALNSQLASYLALAGGTMSGNIAMGGHAITGGGAITGTAITGTSYTGLPIGTNSATGIVQCDGTTTTCIAGVITSIGSSATSMTPLTTTVSTGAAGDILSVTSSGCGSGSPCLAQQAQATTTQGGTGASNATNTANDVLASNGSNGNFVHTVLLTLINTVCVAAPITCTKLFGYANVQWWGAVSVPIGTATGSMANNSSAINAAIAALCALPGGGTVWFGPGAFGIVQGIVINCNNLYLKGSGKNATVLVFNAGSASSALVFSAGASVLSNTGVSDLSIQSGETTFKKIAINASDVSIFTVSNVNVAHYPVDGSLFRGGSGGSECLVTSGRELGLVSRFECYGEQPIEIATNPNSTTTESLDSWVFRDIILVGQPSSATLNLILVDATVAPFNTHFEGHQNWIGGVDGFHWVTTSGAAAFGLYFSGIKDEQPGASGGFTINIEPTSALYNLSIEDSALGGTPRNAVKLRSVVNTAMATTFFNATGSTVGLDADLTNGIITFNSCAWYTGTTATLGAFTNSNWITPTGTSTALPASGVSWH